MLNLLHALVKFGYYSTEEDLRKLVKPLQNLLDGTTDRKFTDISSKYVFIQCITFQ